MKSYTIFELNEILKGTIIGTTPQYITGTEELGRAKISDISFIGNKKYEKLWNTSVASVAVVNKDISIAPGANRAFIQVENADLAMSQVLVLFASPMPEFSVEIHPTAVIDDTAVIGNGVKVGAGCYIGPRTKIDDGTILYPNVTVLDDCVIGKQTVLWSGVVVRERTKIGHQCIIHPNATIGADGFGFRPCPER
ncbi:MAG TPA: LpxD N-terminal domain-containing protein, partial [Flavobacterium sp.]|nr:LpxD N-terminal domain-containing protein [Flavobacterium sp.]